jgi:hypothetical protein
MGKFKEPTLNMKTALLDLLSVVMEYDNGKAGILHDVNGVHHMTLKAMAKPEYGKLILLDASYSASPTGIVWTVAITGYGLKVAKALSKKKSSVNDTEINAGKKKPRNLRTINWQVNVNQETGKQVYEDAKAMKADKAQSFTKTMNNLIAMHKELRVGHVGLLQTLYPEAYATMLLIARNEIEMGHESKVERILEEFQRHMLNTPKNAVNGATSSEPPAKREKVHDDGTENVEMEITVDVNAGRRANELFLKAVFSLQDEPDENPQPVTDSDDGLFVVSKPQPATAPVGLRAGNVPQFAVNFDEDENEDLFT